MSTTIIYRHYTSYRSNWLHYESDEIIRRLNGVIYRVHDMYCFHSFDKTLCVVCHIRQLTI